jgi:putative phosphoesterase
MIVGVISDTHIKDRASKIPDVVYDEFSDVDLIIHCGDLTSEYVLDELGDIAKLIAVKGNMDYLNLPKEKIINIENFKIGVIHGDIIYPRGDLLKMKYYCLEKNLDVLISGHTHTPLIKELNVQELNKRIILLNPGSPTVPRFPIKTIMKIEIDENALTPKLISIK